MPYVSGLGQKGISMVHFRKCGFREENNFSLKSCRKKFFHSYGSGGTSEMLQTNQETDKCSVPGLQGTRKQAVIPGMPFLGFQVEQKGN